MRACERLIKYAKVYTTSDPDSNTVPSAAREFDLAGMLVEEMKALGITDASVDDHCYVTGSIPASKGCEDKPAIGFIAHMDTAPDFCGENVKPQIIENYDGGAVRLGESGRVLDPEMFPELKTMKGCTLITSDGNTLLGADDKAGVAEIMTAAEALLQGRGEDARPHGKICIAFTPDEEIGSGARDLDLEKFGADFGYTVDAGIETEIVYENFNAACAKFEIRGVSVHPGDARNTMVNAALVGMQINAMLPAAETPRDTEGYEGFFHLTHMEGDVDHAVLDYIVRDHSAAIFEARQETLKHIAKIMNERYGEGTVTLTIHHQYSNMIEKIKPHMDIVDTSKDVIRSLGREPYTSPVRGGTDGAELSFRGLPCPNLGTGGFGYHGPYEHITAEGMDFVVKVILGIVERYAK